MLNRRKQLAQDIQKVAYEEVPYVPWGEFIQPSAYRRNVRGMIQFAAPLLWNLSIES